MSEWYQLSLGLTALMALSVAGLAWQAQRSGLLSQRWLWLVLFSVPLLSLGSYLFIGQPAWVLQQAQIAQAEKENQTLVSALAERLAAAPDDVEGWLLLGRSHVALGDWEQAQKAFEQAYQQSPDNPHTLLALAHSLAQLNEGVFSLRAQALVATAYRQIPNDADALWLHALVSRQQGDLKQAHDDLSRLLTQLPADSAQARDLTKVLKQLEETLSSVR
ncbi:MAG: tetratricopeptide repeat protein [Thiomicrospira sp.]|jgi:cytochrome c-type biogenesis protein CcmH|nr:tetratricopeptide repeat protein [Thiomicrospira sp.]